MDMIGIMGDAVNNRIPNKHKHDAKRVKNHMNPLPGLFRFDGNIPEDLKHHTSVLTHRRYGDANLAITRRQYGLSNYELLI